MRGSPRVLTLSLLFALSACATAEHAWDGLDASSGQRLVIHASPTVEYPISGQYRSPQLGDLRLWQYGTRVCGRFEHTRGDERVTGVLVGRLRGNWLHFDWRELRSSTSGTLQRSGDGQFFYDPPVGDQARPRLFGDRDYLFRFDAGHKGRFETSRVGDGAITAIRLDRPLPPQTAACAVDCSC
jgi:hypothetical protein